MKLELEYRNEFNGGKSDFQIGGLTVMMTPCIDEDYWIFRVKLFKDQAIIAFPKFGTIGIGFALEEDWNTNLPYNCETDYIYNHIKKNKKYSEITKAKCIEAINILRKAAKYYMENERGEQPRKEITQDDAEIMLSKTQLIEHYQNLYEKVKERSKK